MYLCFRNPCVSYTFKWLVSARPTMLFVANLNFDFRISGIDGLIRAIARLPDTRIKWKFGRTGYPANILPLDFYHQRVINEAFSSLLTTTLLILEQERWTTTAIWLTIFAKRSQQNGWMAVYSCKNKRVTKRGYFEGTKWFYLSLQLIQGYSGEP